MTHWVGRQERESLYCLRKFEIKFHRFCAATAVLSLKF